MTLKVEQRKENWVKCTNLYGNHTNINQVATLFTIGISQNCTTLKRDNLILAKPVHPSSIIIFYLKN